MLQTAVLCRNEAKSIARCLAGLKQQAEALPPAFRPLIVFVLENGSDDGTAELAQSAALPLQAVGLFEVHAIAGLPAGKARAWNRFLALASSPIVAFVDADVGLSPGALAKLVATLANNPQLDLAGAVPRLAPELEIEGFWQDVFAIPYHGLRPAPSLAGGAYAARLATLSPLPEDTINEDLALSLRHEGRFVLVDDAAVFVVPPKNLGQFLRQRVRILRGDVQAKARFGAGLKGHRRRSFDDVKAYFHAGGGLRLVAFAAALCTARLYASLSSFAASDKDWKPSAGRS